MTEITIGGRRIGPGHPVYVIAEAGSNHDRDLGQARRLIEVAAEAGADAVKFQTFRAEKLYPRSAGQTDYLAVPRSIFDVIRDLEMPFEWIPELAAYAQELGLHFLSTPFDEASADAIEPYVPAYKIASYEMTHHGLVQHCARKQKPLLVSTGTAELEEVRAMVDAFRAVGGRELAILQCTAKYPAPLNALNLRAIETLARAFEVPVGLSDHSREPLPGPMAAVALGATILEKHFTLKNTLPGPDHAYALEPPELTAVIRAVRQVEQTLGDGVKRPRPEETELRGFARRSLFTTRPVAAGEPLTTENLAALRCGKLPYGLHPARFVEMLGRRAVRPLGAEITLGETDTEPLLLRRGEVTLRRLAADDAPLVVAWRARPEVASQMFSAAPPTRAEHDAWFRALELRSDRIELVILDAGRPVGTIGLSRLDFGARTADYGILIGDPEARGRGVALAASQALLDFAFTTLGLTQVALELFADNAPARKLYERLGFKADATPPPPRANRPVLRMTLARP